MYYPVFQKNVLCFLMTMVVAYAPTEQKEVKPLLCYRMKRKSIGWNMNMKKLQQVPLEQNISTSAQPGPMIWDFCHQRLMAGTQTTVLSAVALTWGARKAKSLKLCKSCIIFKFRTLRGKALSSKTEKAWKPHLHRRMSLWCHYLRLYYSHKYKPLREENPFRMMTFKSCITSLHKQSAAKQLQEEQILVGLLGLSVCVCVF